MFKPPIFDYDEAELPAFVGPLMAFGVVALIALITLGMELLTEGVIVAVAAYVLLVGFNAKVSPCSKSNIS